METERRATARRVVEQGGGEAVGDIGVSLRYRLPCKWVSLTCDIPEHGLRTGDVATLVDFVPHLNNSEEGCILENFNAIGESLTEIAVPIYAIEILRSDEILAVRTLSKVS